VDSFYIIQKNNQKFEKIYLHRINVYLFIKDWLKGRQRRLRKLENGKKLESRIMGRSKGEDKEVLVVVIAILITGHLRLR
jgi:hypothetical protein